MMKQLEVQIMGRLLLGCRSAANSASRAVEKGDTAMCKIRDDGR